MLFVPTSLYLQEAIIYWMVWGILAPMLPVVAFYKGFFNFFKNNYGLGCRQLLQRASFLKAQSSKNFRSLNWRCCKLTCFTEGKSLFAVTFVRGALLQIYGAARLLFMFDSEIIQKLPVGLKYPLIQDFASAAKMAQKHVFRYTGIPAVILGKKVLLFKTVVGGNNHLLFH